MDSEKLLIILTTDDHLKASIAYSIALSAQAFGTEVMMFMTGSGSAWALQEVKEHPGSGFPSISEMSQNFCSQDGKEFLCSVCSQSCLLVTALRPSVELAGFSSIIPYIMKGKTLVF